MSDNNVMDYNTMLAEIDAGIATTKRDSLSMLRIAIRSILFILRSLVLRVREIDKQMAKVAE